MRRVRRLADLSQRDLARAIGVAPAVVARWETGGAISVEMFEAVLAVGGLQLAVLLPDGGEAEPMRPTPVMDGGGRRFPAHLDVHPVAMGDERWDRPQREVFAPRRGKRDSRRERLPVVPADHPTAAEVAEDKRVRAAERRLALMARVRQFRLAAGIVEVELPPCECLVECEETAVCRPDCDCQCEPAGPRHTLRALNLAPA